MKKIINVVGARPNFMKIAPIMTAMKQNSFFYPLLLHTGQHYDPEMSRLFFDDLGLPVPDINLGIGSGSHSQQTARIMLAFEEVVLAEKPDLVLVVGDVNSTIACALVASKLQIQIAHVEAGLRSYDRSMPEEINRLLTDQLADYLFTTSRQAGKNLHKEGISPDKVFFVGNTMIDTLLTHKERAARSGILSTLGLQPQNYAVLTLHRPSNVDDKKVFTEILSALELIQNHLKIVLPAHPRTQQRLLDFDLHNQVQSLPNLIVCQPLGYLDFLKLMIEAKLVLTDSGGIQEETTVLGVPCLTLRENTERPITVEQGTNLVIGNKADHIFATVDTILQGQDKRGQIPELWDGKAGKRIVKILHQALLGYS